MYGEGKANPFSRKKKEEMLWFIAISKSAKIGNA